MNPVDGRQQKIVFGRDHDPEYASKLKAAKAQADSDNSFMWGQQQMMDDIEQDGAGMIAEEARNRKYGNVNIETRPLMQGQDAAGVQEDSAGNQALENPLAQTGWLQGEVSGTIDPQTQPGEEMAELGMENASRRVNGIANGQQWGGLNDRQQTWRT